MKGPKKSQDGLDRAQIDKLLKQELKNIEKKIADGKTLTSEERRILSSVSSGGKSSDPLYAKSQVELAQFLNVTRQTLNIWLKEDGNPGVSSDGRFDVAAWREWAAKNGKRGQDGLNAVVLKAKNLLLQNDKLEFQLNILRREYVPVSDVVRVGAELGAAIRKVVAGLHMIAPSVVGMTVIECEAYLKEKETEIISQLHQLDASVATMKEVRADMVIDEQAKSTA